MRRAFINGATFIVLTALWACGDGGGGGSPAEPVTLYYVVTWCREDARTVTSTQRLQVVRGDEAPVVVAEAPILDATMSFPAIGLCPLYGEIRNGNNGVFALSFQRIGVSPDGADIVFELNFEFSLWRALGVRNPLTAEQQGIFFVHSDGTGLRRLGDPSREPAQRLGGIPSASMRFTAGYYNVFFAFSPDGKTIAFADRGPGPEGEDAAQVAIMDVATGERELVTRLPLVTKPDPNPVAPAILSTFWLNDEIIGFRSRANPDGLNPDNNFVTFLVRRDGTDLKISPDFVPAALPDSRFVPMFTITQPLALSSVGSLSMPGTPQNPFPDFQPPDPPIQEIFLFGAKQTLQLTKFDRVDTLDPVLDSDSQRVFFLSSTNRLGTNPTENCQIFSVNTAGGDLRQLTNFSATDHSSIGCQTQGVDITGCKIFGLWINPGTRTIVFDSSCDPLGTNPAGHQIFAINPDGTDIRQLTSLRGVVTGADGSVEVEMPCPMYIRFR